MSIEEQLPNPVNPIVPGERMLPEPDAITYDEYSLIRQAFERMPHPIRRINKFIGQLLEGLGPQ